jgi:hypothetical protein
MADKKSVEVEEKSSAAATERVGAPREEDEVKAEAAERKDEAAQATLRAAADYWTTCYGGFHMSANTGRAVYRYPAQATGTGYDTTWAYVDDLPVGGRQGWTYKENGFVFYMFFARQAQNGKYWVGYSQNNQNFTFYAWAD